MLAEAMLKDQVDKRFITYMQVLRYTHVVNIPVRVFCWLACKNGCPAGFKDYNDRTLHTPNMDIILDMLKWDEEELHQRVFPSMSAEEFAQLTPKQIGTHLVEWFQVLGFIAVTNSCLLHESKCLFNFSFEL